MDVYVNPSLMEANSGCTQAFIVPMGRMTPTIPRRIEVQLKEGYNKNREHL